MTQFISHIHRELRNARRTRRGSTMKEPPRGIHKTYPRMEKIVLPKPESLDMRLTDALRKRTSYSGGNPDTDISLPVLSTLLGQAIGKRVGTHKRSYPSGSGLYPIETYLIAHIDSTEHYVFHYNPTDHSLEKLWKLGENIKLKQLVPVPDDLLFSALFVFTSVWHRSSAKYGDFTYTLALLEAGHISQNLLLTGTALQLRSRPMAGFNDDKIAEILDLDAEYEQPVHTIVFST